MLEPFYHKPGTEAGVDEAGRGCLAGPVVAAAVILPKHFDLPGLNDSKKLSPKKRSQLRLQIEEQTLAWAIGICDNEEIDRLNILRATYRAMHRAIKKLSIRPALLLIDGKYFQLYPQIPHQCIIKGDGKYASIAAASILAKTFRDRYMKNLHQQYPVYQWDKNKGYPTAKHREAIRRYGISPYHRRSFRLLNDQKVITFS